jgi:hypothetical protein
LVSSQPRFLSKGELVAQSKAFYLYLAVTFYISILSFRFHVRLQCGRMSSPTHRKYSQCIQQSNHYKNSNGIISVVTNKTQPPLKAEQLFSIRFLHKRIIKIN